jgi:hypothetical protein
MRQFLVESKVSLLIALATSTVFGLAPISSVQAAAIGQAQSNSTVQTSGTLVASYENSCESETLSVGDQITIGESNFPLEGDDNGPYITYTLEDENDNYTYSVTSFESDCQTVYLQTVEGVDLSGSDVDE